MTATGVEALIAGPAPTLLQAQPLLTLMYMTCGWWYTPSRTFRGRLLYR